MVKDLSRDEFVAFIKQRALAESTPAAMLNSALVDMRKRPDLYSPVQYQAIAEAGTTWAGSVEEMMKFIEGFR